jgi:lipoprotein-anchoring transpeptidase ErfK/SrfK
MFAMKISRRKLLKLSGGILAAAPFVHVAQPSQAQLLNSLALDVTKTRLPFGRTFYRGTIHETASPKAKVVGKFKVGDVLPLTGETIGTGPTDYNPIWYQTKTSEGDVGYVHSAQVHPCDNVLNKPVATIDERGVWGEVTVPLASARNTADPKASQRFPGYYSLLVRIVSVREGTDKKPWYEIKEDKWSHTKTNSFIAAEQIRIIPESEFDTISPNVPVAKWMEINLKQQTMTAYEDDVPVYVARLASGTTGYDTPVGEHWIYVKTPGQRMFGGAAGDGSSYDLPAIPWVSYFTPVGHSFHGTYWHNDYGRPRSHGCANLPSLDAKWVFRWSYPVPDYWAEDGFTTVTSKADRETQGTKVIVKAE